jgi:hypothetical protein
MIRQPRISLEIKGWTKDGAKKLDKINTSKDKTCNLPTNFLKKNLKYGNDKQKKK